jgi:prevent-host-death family protein
MVELNVGVRELKSRLSEYLRRAQAGQSVLVTDRGQPVARIVPVGQPLDVRLQMMAQAGLLQWSGKKLEPMPPVARTRGERSVAELLVEDRE